MAQRYLEAWLPKIDSMLKGAAFYAREGERNDAAFSLHQAVERAYACFLLVQTSYFPRSHNIKFLRSIAEDADKSLAAAWPREAKLDRRRFELLKRAYVEARYSEQFDVSIEDLAELTKSAAALRDLVKSACEARIEVLSAGNPSVRS